MSRDIRPTLRKFVFGSLFSSLSFWCVALILLLAVWNLVDLWRFTQRMDVLSGSFGQMLLVGAFVLAMGSYVFFSNLFRMRNAAREETDEEKRALIVDGLDLALKMYYFGVGSLAFGLVLCSMVLRK
jgi:ABC-type nickel/cobalt efflux system permease component RcnA